MKYRGFLFLFFFCLISCKTADKAVVASPDQSPELPTEITADPVVVISNRIVSLRHSRVAFFPFQYNKDDGTNQEFRKTVTGNYQSTFETYFIKTGFDIIEDEKVARIIDEQNLSADSLTDEDRKKIGKLLQIDTLVSGMINNYDILPVRGSEPIKDGFIYPVGDRKYNGFISFNLKAVHAETGTLLWKMNLSAKITNMPGDSYSEYYERALKKVCDEGVEIFIRDYFKMKPNMRGQGQ